MSDINFIKPLSPKKQEAIHRWMKISTFGTFFILLTLATITGYQIYLLVSLNKEKLLLQPHINQFNTIKQKIEQMQSDEKILNQKTKNIESILQESKDLKILLEEIATLIPEDAALVGIKYYNDKLELDGHAFANKSILAFRQNLNKSSHIQNVRLKHLQQEVKTVEGKSLVHFSLNGKIKR